jgi:hypothetical protein
MPLASISDRGAQQTLSVAAKSQTLAPPPAYDEPFLNQCGRSGDRKIGWATHGRATDYAFVWIGDWRHLRLLPYPQRARVPIARDLEGLLGFPGIGIVGGDVFGDELDLAKLGFGGVDPEATGRPFYHPSALLKLYIDRLPQSGSVEPPAAAGGRAQR